MLVLVETIIRHYITSEGNYNEGGGGNYDVKSGQEL